MKALSENFPSAQAISLYDKKHQLDEKYFPGKHFVAASSNRWASMLKIVLSAAFGSSDTLIYGHINLAPLALFIKKLRPSKKMHFIAHGIEVWNELSSVQQKALEKADLILAVSSYTKKKLVDDKGIEANKIQVFHNTIDPFFEKPTDFNKPAYLQKRYGFNEKSKVVFTLCRLSAKEAYKGYDRVVEALPEVLRQHPEAVYLIAGKYDEEEKQRVEHIVQEKGVLDKVIFTGFLKDKEIMDHYLLADLFVMPSKNEGFGIVYLEAMMSGLPVIAGNVDGSVDALKNGELGTLVDPDNIGEIAEAIIQNLKRAEAMDEAAKKELQRKVMESFGFGKFQNRLKGFVGKEL